ncbi:hypothetical protein BJF83_01690 [Nocardiopsis sp. CNR-923]|uniref:hypothetical protein n=1 Tax=Nocardiopsis sp. CNR-923 TaxID=1904965 RepID=UPI00096289B1|nr:hypothetical protein [Nocardiopsis sp. CNR-923]OLT28198.1 hypothetical protein BJF83_01690 [Nocardiopsis sp. CNR-923]
MRASRRKQGARTTEGAPAPRTPFEFIEGALFQPGAKADKPVVDNDPGSWWERRRPTDDEGFGRIRGFQRQGGNLAPTAHHRGSAASWVAVGLAFVGFTMCGLAVVLGWTAWMLIVGGLLMAAALVVAVMCDILADVVLDPPRYESEEPHATPLHQIKQERARRLG